MTSKPDGDWPIIYSPWACAIPPGRPCEAIATEREAVRAYAGLSAALPGAIAPELGLANAHNNLGLAQTCAGDLTAALESYRSTIESYSRLSAAAPELPEFRDGLANAHNNSGQVQQPSPT